MNTISTHADSSAQLRTLYRSLLEHEDRYQEFKQLLAHYPAGSDTVEGDGAAEARDKLNARIREWVGDGFDGLSAMQVKLWRTLLIEERFNVVLSPWKEANFY